MAFHVTAPGIDDDTDTVLQFTADLGRAPERMPEPFVNERAARRGEGQPLTSPLTGPLSALYQGAAGGKRATRDA